MRSTTSARLRLTQHARSVHAMRSATESLVRSINQAAARMPPPVPAPVHAESCEEYLLSLIAADVRAMRMILEEQEQRRADGAAFTAADPGYRLAGRAL